ncbi:DUF4393 domain-containing protein [Pseudomonas capsici]|uniref:DUF4393 domain-containing protein n=1 Tax=Pseudomonas capsici TaxID=2810614 RepID=A0ABT3BWF1_9PSED|nr:DUF4393 domain-containing protein [Pseudomonas capsici]MCV4268243.1 DUF4393 domain-containing protein [Pseudomonas capsici]MCV4278704.1 DUF4393 domain-containing protein [Pseudomonas capsici]MCV4331936.1 DUF4393 domain-containing protein [Pseudomonas capsici]MCV4377046.1 DUF4393 domain-containing protein [Pseudomonas capsici]
MGEEENSSTDNNVSATIDAVTGLAKAVPIYEDAIQPVAKQLGKSLEVVGRAVNVALMPVKGLVWSFEEIEKLFKPKLVNNLKDVPPEDIVPPKPNVAGPAIEALRYSGHEESLRDMYANLLAAAMDKKTADGAHPAFVEIIKQLTPDEAKLVSFFMQHRPFPIVNVVAVDEQNSGEIYIAINVSLFGSEAALQIPNMTPSYIDNLVRLGILEVRNKWAYNGNNIYTELEQCADVEKYKNSIVKNMRFTPRLDRGAVGLTNLGKHFGGVCVISKSAS